MRAWSVGDRPGEVSACTAEMAAARKWPDCRSAGIGVSGAGCRVGWRKGAGIVRGERGW